MKQYRHSEYVVRQIDIRCLLLGVESSVTNGYGIEVDQFQNLVRYVRLAIKWILYSLTSPLG